MDTRDNENGKQDNAKCEMGREKEKVFLLSKALTVRQEVTADHAAKLSSN